MENKVVDIEIVKQIATALQDLRPDFAFVGGSIVSLYVNDPSADTVRQTIDIDLSISLKGYGAWARLQDELSRLGFSPDRDSKIICRYLYNGVTVDIMPDDENILGFSNPWYKSGLAKLEPHLLDNGLSINLFPLPYFIATKFSAFRGRGRGDHRTSHDFEDIVYAIDNVTNVVDQIKSADEDVKEFLTSEYRAVLDHQNRKEIISCHLSKLIRDARYPLIVDKIAEIVG